MKQSYIKKKLILMETETSNKNNTAITKTDGCVEICNFNCDL